MAPPATSPDRVESALDRVESWVDDEGIPGASIALVDGSEVVATDGFGRRGPDRPATGDTLYAVGSVTKPVTALATLVLADRKGIDLDDPIADYVPYFADAPGEPVTVGRLLSHTSGMPNDDLAFAADALDGWDEFRSFVAESTDRGLLDDDRFYYYNSGYAVLDRLVTAVSGTEFPTFVRRAVFDPLEMREATFDRSVFTDPSADVMTPYVSAAEEFRDAAGSENPILTSDLLRAPGGLLASVTDLARLVRAHLADDPPLSETVFDRLSTRVATRERLVDGTETAYGHGLESEPFGSDRLVGHGGNTGCSGGYVGFLEDAGVGIAIAHTGVADGKAATRDALAVLVGVDPDAIDPVAAVDAVLDDLVGRYESPGGNHHATVRRDEARLDVAFGGDGGRFEVRALPLDLSGSLYRFTDVDCAESTTDVEWYAGDTPKLVFEGMPFRRVGPRSADGD
ncbi:serine hydrolase [Halosimplex litoreum]|uniref:Serine hydrolase n=1 Tax=Halosimplex litoreum TaxID=1198301 RepID=A0A7T3FYD6_9EURY|nr:serine hydrolase domain-containing protein [Halosimplex litoreum]QPV62990.1 serine hydrolase [Halosimplex litoreum]